VDDGVAGVVWPALMVPGVDKSYASRTLSVVRNASVPLRHTPTPVELRAPLVKVAVCEAAVAEMM